VFVLPVAVSPVAAAFDVTAVAPPENGFLLITGDNIELDSAARAQAAELGAEVIGGSSLRLVMFVLSGTGSMRPRGFVDHVYEVWKETGHFVGDLAVVLLDDRHDLVRLDTGYAARYLVDDMDRGSLGARPVEALEEGRVEDAVMRVLWILRGTFTTDEAIEKIAERRTVKLAEWQEIQSRPESVLGFILYPDVLGNDQANRILAVYMQTALVFTVVVLSLLIVVAVFPVHPYTGYRLLAPAQWWGFFVFPVPYLVLYPVIRATRRSLRSAPRRGPKTGRPMHRLEGDDRLDYLGKAEQVEDSVGSIEYDVWLTDDRSEYAIHPYPVGGTHFRTCPDCGRKTYHTVKAWHDQQDRLHKRFECEHCGRRRGFSELSPS
jgi:uncharacterized protein